MKEYLNTSLVQINFDNNDYKFCQIIVQKPNKNLIQVVSYTGKLGNQGRKAILFEYESDNVSEKLEEAIQIGKSNIKKRLEAGFHYKYWVEKKLKEVINKEPDLVKPKKEEIENIKSKPCDLCTMDIDIEKYEQINLWARNEGGWDEDENFIGYQIVICIPCQIEKQIFKKIFRKNKTFNKSNISK